MNFDPISNEEGWIKVEDLSLDELGLSLVPVNFPEKVSSALGAVMMCLAKSVIVELHANWYPCTLRKPRNAETVGFLNSAIMKPKMKCPRLGKLENWERPMLSPREEEPPNEGSLLDTVGRHDPLGVHTDVRQNIQKKTVYVQMSMDLTDLGRIASKTFTELNDMMYPPFTSHNMDVREMVE